MEKIIEILDLIKIKKTHARDEWINSILRCDSKNEERHHAVYNALDDLYDQILHAALNSKE